MAGRNSERVRRIIRFIENLTVPSGKGEGGPFRLRPFQKRFIRDVYGPVDKDGLRIVRRAILSEARKNGKTALIADLALAHLVGPEAIKNGEIYSAATEREQAALVFKYARQIVQSDPELSSMIKVVDSTKTMLCYANGSTYKAISAEAGSKFGYNPTVVIYDELAQARNRDLYDALDSSMGARLEPLLIVISTQSNDPQHILSQLIDDGLSSNDPSTVCHLYEIPEDADVFDEKNWKLANPALNDFRSLEEMRTAAKRAKRMPSFEAAFRNLYCNQRVDAKSPLIARAEWEGCKGEATIEPGSSIYLALDLSGKTDLTALVGVSTSPKDSVKIEHSSRILSLDEFIAERGFVPNDAAEYKQKNRKWPKSWEYEVDKEVHIARLEGYQDVVKAWFWKPGDTIREHENRDRVPYWTWKQQGYIETTPGRAVNYDFVAERLAGIMKEYNILGMAYDRWSIDDFLNACNRIGLDAYVDGKDKPRSGALRMVPWGQGFKDMAPAIDAMEVSILERKLSHDGNPVLTWNISNAMSVSDPAGNRKLDKSKTRFRIDGAVALAMVLGLKSRDMAQEVGPSVYETRGLMLV